MSQQPQDPGMKFQGVTKDEMRKIQKSMKRPQFMGLLSEYMVQISDPKNKAEYDQYLQQMEKQGQLPKHLKLVKIQPEFCFRTHIISNKNKKHEMKLFINVCSCSLMQKPDCQLVPGQNGKPGYSWKIPNSMGKIRYDQDRHGNVCQTVDAAFHPDTFKLISNPSFQAMVIGIALQSAQKQLGQRKQLVSKDYVILKKVKCKGGEPALLPVRMIEGKMYNKGQGPTAQQQRNLQGKQTKLQKDINKQKEQFEKQKKQKKTQGKEDVMQHQEQQLDLQDNKKNLIEDLEKGPQRPKYSTIYTYPVDYSEFMNEPSAPKKKPKRKLPASFNVEFQLPKIQKFEEIKSLDINPNKIVLNGGDKYFIDLNFQELKVKYNLLTADAKAKFDKKKKILRIIIPVQNQIQQQYEEVVQQQQPNQGNNAQETSEQPRVVQNQTWKQRILEPTETNVNLQIVDREQFEQQSQQQKKKPLVEQIDEDDYIQDTQNQASRQLTLTKFSVKDYYKKQEKKQQSKPSIDKIQFVFQQTKDKVVLVLKMPNYNKKEVKYYYDKEQILMIWSHESWTKIAHLKIRVEQQKMQKIAQIQRIGFMAFAIDKVREQIGKFWQKTSVTDEITKQALQLIQKTEFQEKIRHLQSKKQQKIEQERKAQQIQQQHQIQQKTNQNNIEKTKENIANDANKITESTNTSQNNKVNIQSHQEVESSISHKNIFNVAQPQFILFEASFIDQLN